MIKRRIHTLKSIIEVSQEPYEDEDGNIVFPEPQEPLEIEKSCRAESNTVDGRTPVKDGFKLEYSYLVFTETDMPFLPLNTNVKVYYEGSTEVFGEGEVVKFERGQRVTRIWLK